MSFCATSSHRRWSIVSVWYILASIQVMAFELFQDPKIKYGKAHGKVQSTITGFVLGGGVWGDG